ncbi:MAG: divalent-cation tolerance protein CutA [Desulfobacterales bacterium]|nr:divalent-cation tolerance protein CutA [Desulfobacterales bacterium]
MDIRFVYMTAGGLEEARRIGRGLVESRLAACVNILPGMQSVYRWEGKVEEAVEVVVIAKTTASCVAALTERVKSLHSYDCPCVVSLKVDGGHQHFLDWIGANVSP